MSQSIGSAAAAEPRPARAIDVMVPAVILLAVLVVVAPVPAPVVDLLLAANLTVSVLALLGALAARTPLEMSVFPTFLLGSTLVRLVLNIATTRLILTRAVSDGPTAAGEVVQAFGEFVAANSLVVGGVIFAIIAVIQFVVITAGSTRTSEVAARFALDGLPGRQMAIDADLQAGAITRDHARGLRAELQRQADFFASMDGASRFVRGEAVAGVIITAVNLFGGLAIGVVQHSMPVPRALDVYSRLTIGDGLVTAVPALLVSVATGLLISRSSQSVDLSGELGRQFTSRPHVLAITGIFLLTLSLTGLPFVPLAGIGAVMLVAAIITGRRGRPAAHGDAGRAVAAGLADVPHVGDAVAARASARVAAASAASLESGILTDERIVVVLGAGLAGLVTGEAALLSLTGSMRKAVAADLGLVVPAVSFRDEPTVADRGYRVIIAGETVCEGEIPRGRLLAVPGPGEPAVEGVTGVETVDPLTRRAAAWVSHAQAEVAARRGATLIDAAGCVARAIEAAVRRRADQLLSRDGVARLVESLRAAQPAVVEQMVPGVLTIARIQRTLQCLLREGVPIRPLPELLEVMADHAADTQEPAALAEFVRRALARTICRRARDPEGRLSVVRLHPEAIQRLVDPGAVVDRVAARPLVAELRRAVRPRLDRAAAAVLVVPAAARRGVREALAGQLPDLQVLADEEVADERNVEVFATVGGGDLSRAA